MGNSPLFNLNWSDLLKGVLVAFLAIFVGEVYTTVNNGQLPTLLELKADAILGIKAGVAYLLKNLLTGVGGVFGKK